MKTLKLLALAAFVMLFSQCKTAAPTAPSSLLPPFAEVVKILDTTQKKFLQFADSTNGNPWKAIMRTTEWVKTQSNVQAVEALDSTYINILLKSGLQTTFFFDRIDANGHSLTKGGGGASLHNNPELLGNSILSNNTITNKKVLLYLAGFSQFYTAAQIQKILDYFTNSGLGLTVTVLKDDQCSYKTVESFKDYGLVIIDTHGGPDVFLSGSSLSVYPNINLTDEQSKITIIDQLGQDCFDKLSSGLLRFSASISINLQIPGWQRVSVGFRTPIAVTTAYLHTLHSMPSTVVFGNMCYSGQSSPAFNNKTPMRTAFLEKSPISYYGFAFDDGTSNTVSVPFSNAILDTFVRALVVDTDSTGRAHLQPDGSEFADLKYVGKGFFFKHFGSDDYSYSSCDTEFTDARDGQKYKAVCIGNQTWMAENLRYNAPGSVCYNDNVSNCDIYGRMYTWETVMAGASPSNTAPSGVKGICPKGWHLPSEVEWTTLVNTVGGADVAGGPLKSTSSLWTPPNTGATNSSGFSALPGGIYYYANTGVWKYIALGTVGFWWSTTLGTRTQIQPEWFKTYNNLPDFILGDNGIDQQIHLSCRCLKD